MPLDMANSSTMAMFFFGRLICWVAKNATIAMKEMY
jgi:hypothetical protein